MYSSLSGLCTPGQSIHGSVVHGVTLGTLWKPFRVSAAGFVRAQCIKGRTKCLRSDTCA
jgi:hypothetical protein